MRIHREGRAIAETCRRLAADGLVYGTAGNVSVLLDDRVVITPSGIDYERMRARDMSVVALEDGRVLAGRHTPSSETPLHLAVYRATDARAIVHTHAEHATTIGLVLDELPAVHYAIHALGGPVRVAPYACFGSDELARGVVAAIVERNGCLMRNHGAVTIGSTLDIALDRSLRLEWVAALAWRALLVGSPTTLTEGQLDEVRERARTIGYRP